MSLEGFVTVMHDGQPVGPPGETPRVLVVDDQPANIQVIGGMLGKQGYEIVPASDGETALKRLALRLPDLVLLDVLMPGMDGVEVCRRIRANPEWKDIPIIFLSAADDKDMIVRALEAGGVDYVTKPFNHAEMLSRVRTHLALKQTRDRLRNLAEDKDELLGILAHDLKSHLGGIEMTAGLLSDRLPDTTDGKQRQLCANICQTAGQLLSFVKEFLANAAADHGITLKPERLNLTEIIPRAVQDYQEAARRKNLVLETAVPEAAAYVDADLDAFRQVLDNLISNALKFSPVGKKIRVTVQRTDLAVECRIQDEGPGFTPADKTRMFRRYVRLSARPTGGEPSTGLGLSIVYKLVRAMAGELICDSNPGQGTTFIIRFSRGPNR